MTTLAFDTETKGLDWFDPDQQAFLVSWRDQKDSHVAHVDDAEGMAAFRAAVDEADTLVAHNLSFDVHQVRESLGLDLLQTGKNLVDTDLLSRVVIPERRNVVKKDDDEELEDNPQYGYKLKNLGQTYIDPSAGDAEKAIIELAKTAGIKLKSTGGYYDLYRAYPAEMETYAKLDSDLAYDLLPILASKLRPEQRPIWELEKRVAPILIEAEQRGVMVDQTKVVPLKEEYTARAETSRAASLEVLGDDILGEKGGLSSSKLRERLVELGVPLYRKTDKGQLATNQYALAEFAADYPVINDLLEWRTADKFLATYIDPMVDRDTVHTSFWQMGAWTGRMSCSRPNMQNIPARAGAEVREMFVPRPGHCFVVADYDSIEIRLLAHYLNDAGFKDMIDNGHDPHAWMASQIWGGTADMYHKGTDGEKLRGLAKNILFAITYGAGGPRVMDMLLAAGMGATPESAKGLILTIKRALPGYWDLAGPRGRIRRKVNTSGFVTTMMGRRQPIKREKAYVGLNALIQGSAADLMKQGVVNVSEVVKAHGALPVLFVHDEIVVETPIEEATRVKELTENAMADANEGMRPRLEVTSTLAHNNYAEGK